MLRYDMPDGPDSTANAIGYYELTCQIPSVGGAWPAWWSIGHQPGQPHGYNTWGPEIDIFEFYNTQTNVMASTLHKGSSEATSYCFMTGGTNPPSNDPAGTAVSEYANYSGSATYNVGSISYTPGFDFAAGYHRYGVKVDTNYNISIWVDDVLVGEFAAEQYCDDSGTPVSVELILNLALGNGSDPVGSIDTSGFGGINNTTSTNKFRFSIANIQIWGP
jgi:beta-glucanase (GH16 family)